MVIGSWGEMSAWSYGSRVRVQRALATAAVLGPLVLCSGCTSSDTPATDAPTVHVTESIRSVCEQVMQVVMPSRPSGETQEVIFLEPSLINALHDSGDPTLSKLAGRVSTDAMSNEPLAAIRTIHQMKVDCRSLVR